MLLLEGREKENIHTTGRPVKYGHWFIRVISGQESVLVGFDGPISIGLDWLLLSVARRWINRISQSLTNTKSLSSVLSLLPQGARARITRCVSSRQVLKTFGAQSHLYNTIFWGPGVMGQLFIG